MLCLFYLGCFISNKMFRVASYLVLVTLCLQHSSLGSEISIQNWNIGTRNVNISFDLGCDCGQVAPKWTRRIINGRPSERHAYPFVVAIFQHGRFALAGSLINDRYVLTSGQHFVNSREGYEVLLGIDDSRGYSSGITRKIKRIILHPNYRVAQGPWPSGPHLFDDIALVELQEPVALGRVDHVGQVCLPFDMERSDFFNTEAKIVGWGFVNTASVKATTLRETDVKVLSTDACVEKLKPNGFVYDKEVCALGPGHSDICHDEGGPLFTKLMGSYVQIGIISKGHGIPCNKLHLPSIYTSIAEYRDWILEETQNAVYCS